MFRLAKKQKPPEFSDGLRSAPLVTAARDTTLPCSAPSTPAGAAAGSCPMYTKKKKPTQYFPAFKYIPKIY